MEHLNIDQWNHDFQEFVTYWEQEASSIRTRKIGSHECSAIADDFQRNLDLLLLRQPGGYENDEAMARIDMLIGKIDTSLAMAISCITID